VFKGLVFFLSLEVPLVWMTFMHSCFLVDPVLLFFVVVVCPLERRQRFMGRRSIDLDVPIQNAIVVYYLSVCAPLALHEVRVVYEVSSAH